MTIELVDIIATSLSEAGAPQVGDRTVIARSGSLYKSAPLKMFGSTVAGTPVVVDMVANGITGSFALGLHPAASTTVQVEFSRDNQATYVTAGSYSADQSIQYTKGATDTNFVTHLRLTRMAGSGTSTYDVANGVVAITGAQMAMIGVFRRKAMVVDGTTRIGLADPVNDRGYILESQGPGSNVYQIQSDLVAPWDRSLGAVGFAVERCSIGACSVNAAPDLCTFTGSIAGTTLTVTAKSAGALAAQQILNCANVLNRTRIFQQLSGTTGGIGTYQLTVTGLSTSQTVASQPMTTGVALYNPRAYDLVQDGEAVLFKSNEADVWVVQ